METNEWIKEFPAAITVCDQDGTILEMNNASIDTFKDEGGKKIIGTNLMICHPEPAQKKIVELIAEQKKNVYTIEKKGVKKLIYQSPWFKEGKFSGMVELSLEIPSELPHFVRD